MDSIEEFIRAEPAYRQLSQAIQKRILSGALPIGQVLPSELALASQWGVNRGTVREAIRQLEQEGLLRRHKGGKKLIVSVPEKTDVSNRLQTAMILHEVTFRELWEVMAALEPMSAESSARNASPELLVRLTENVDKTSRCLEDHSALAELDIEFHDLVAQASGNRALQLSHEALSALFYPAFMGVLAKLNAGERLYVAHKNILEALKERDDKGARSWMERHIADFKRGYEFASLDLEHVVGP